MKNGLVTIVLPIYNVEKYLNRCIESIVGQTYKNIEIILVDDGSPDFCPKMCDEWANKDNRIKVVHKQNAGLGMARNTGIENASGEFICFFDSDDYIAPDTIEKTYNLAEKENADIVIFGYSEVSNEGKVLKTVVPKLSKKVYSGQQSVNEFLAKLIAPGRDGNSDSGLKMSAWDCLYSMKMIMRLGWKFVSERSIISEDVYSLLYLYKDVERIAILPEALYFYCENDASLTHVYRPDRYEKIKLFYNECCDACDKIGYDKSIKQALGYPYLSNTIAAMKMIVLSSEKKSIINQKLRGIVNDQHLQKFLLDYDSKKESFNRRLLLLALRCRQTLLVKMLIKAKS